MKYRVLDFHLNIVTGWHSTKENAVNKCIETMNQDNVWFIGDLNREIVSIVHCGTEWLAVNKEKNNEESNS